MLAFFVCGAFSVYTWARRHNNGYECSSLGDTRFSALNAYFSDGLSIEHKYQLFIKGYWIYGDDWRLGKGKAPLTSISPEQQWQAYLNLWRLWFHENKDILNALDNHLRSNDITVLTDRFATTPINQARAISQILNEMKS